MTAKYYKGVIFVCKGCKKDSPFPIQQSYDFFDFLCKDCRKIYHWEKVLVKNEEKRGKNH